jgi:WD40 repeat protein
MLFMCSTGKDGSVCIWDIRKGGRDSVVLCLDWHQDHTALTSGTSSSKSSQTSRIGGSNVNSFRKVDWKKVEACRAHDMAAISVKVYILTILSICIHMNSNVYIYLCIYSIRNVVVI